MHRPPQTFAHFLRNGRGRGSLASLPVNLSRDTSLSIRPRLRSCSFALVVGLVSTGFIPLASASSGSAGSLDLGVSGFRSEAPEVLRASAPVDASACGDESSAITSRVGTELQALFLEASVLPGAAVDPILGVTISPFEDPENPGYTAVLELVIDGEPLADGRIEVSCELCTHGELATKIREEGARLIERLRTELSKPDPVPEGPDPEGSDPTQPDLAPEPQQDVKPAKLGPLGFIGIASAGVGLGALGGGAILIKQGDRLVRRGLDEEPRETRGVVLVGVGAAALITGVALIVVDRVRAKKAAKQ